MNYDFGDRGGVGEHLHFHYSEKEINSKLYGQTDGKVFFVFVEVFSGSLSGQFVNCLLL